MKITTPTNISLMKTRSEDHPVLIKWHPLPQAICYILVRTSEEMSDEQITALFSGSFDILIQRYHITNAVNNIVVEKGSPYTNYLLFAQDENSNISSVDEHIVQSLPKKFEGSCVTIHPHTRPSNGWLNRILLQPQACKDNDKTEFNF